MEARFLSLMSVVIVAVSCGSGLKKTKVETAKAKLAPTIVSVERVNRTTGKSEPVKVEVTKIECRKDRSVRHITLENKTNRANIESPSCFVKYKKDELTKVVAKATYQTAYCTKVMENLRSNLSESGYVCNPLAAVP